MASVCSTVPVSTATDMPQKLLNPVNFAVDEALAYTPSPAWK